MKTPIFIAHRGAWDAGRRENTAGAIERAANSGRFAYIEVDVRRTRSDDSSTQTPILIHDSTLDRQYEMYNVPKSKRRKHGQAISGLTLNMIRAEEIEVATLAEGMRSAKGHPLNLELKASAAIEPTVEVIQDMIAKYPEWTWEKIVFSSFNWKLLEEVKQKAPQAGVALLYGWRNVPKSFGRTYHQLGARWIMFNKYLAPFLSPLGLLMNVRHRAVYTVNSKFGVRLLQLFGVDSFTTDKLTLPDQFPSAK